MKNAGPKKTAGLQQMDNQFVHPWEMVETIGTQKRTVIDGSDGIYLYDTDGNKLLDAPAGMWCVNVGHRRKEMADAIADQIMQVSYASPWSLTNTKAAELADRLSELSPGDLNHVFFTTGGSTAVDSALRFVQFYNNYVERPNKKLILAHEMGYHGSTYLCGTVSGKPKDKNHLDFAHDLVRHLPCPHPFFRKEGQTVDEFCQERLAFVEKTIQEIGAENIGVMIGEPVMASGGVVVPPPGYWKGVRALCTKHDILLIADEVVTAFGRLGHYFASDTVFEMKPDMITCAKGLTSGYVPMGALMISDRLISTFTEGEDIGAMFAVGYTYSGHPVAAAAALKNLEILEREGLPEKVLTDTGPYFQKRLRELEDIPMVSEVRGTGLMGAVDCINAEGQDSKGRARAYEIGNLIDKRCQTLGLIVRPIVSMCVMSPPLIITREQIDTLVDTLRQGIELAQDDAVKEGLWTP
ncbi:MAG: aminotransferase [Pseudomonadota bacterium]